MEKYCAIGNLFCLGRTGRTFGGPCILGPDAIYLIVTGDCASNQLNTSMRGIAGAMDRAQGLIQMVPIAGLDHYEVTMEELAEKVGDDSDWPVEPVGERAFVFPKSSIERLRFGPLAGLNFKVEGRIRVNVSCGLKQRQAGMAYLRNQGWPLDTRSLLDRIRRRAA